MIKSYDPNASWATHVLEVTLMQWDFQKVIEVKISGNCKGGSLFDSMADTLLDHAEIVDTVILKNESGEELCVEIDNFRDVERMIVGVQIKEVRPYQN